MSDVGALGDGYGEKEKAKDTRDISQKPSDNPVPRRLSAALGAHDADMLDGAPAPALADGHGNAVISVADVFGLIGAGAVVGCGSKMHMDDLPWWGRFLMATWTAISVLCRWASGALFVCRADAFHDVGGFSEDLYVTEEIDLSRRLKKWGRKRGLKFVILRAHPLHTSSRKLQLYSGAEIARQFFRLCVRPGRSLKDRKYLSMWYDGRR